MRAFACWRPILRRSRLRARRVSRRAARLGRRHGSASAACNAAQRRLGVILMRLPAGMASPMEMGRNAEFEPLGTIRDVVARISEVAPATEWANVEWGTGWFRAQSWSIEILPSVPNLDGMIEWLRLFVRGRGDDAAALTVRLAVALGCVVFDDGGAPTVISASDDAEGWRAHQRECEQPA